MISERCSISSSPDGGAETAASAAVTDRMVKIEMEPAEALANLSQPLERGSPGYFGWKMAGKAKKGRKRVKCDSPPSPAFNPADSAPSCSDLAQDPSVLFQQHDERNLMNLVKVERDDQLLHQSHICTADYLSLGGEKSSQNLPEAEKEAKRLRRVLANRESARRTIHRRQAVSEELARKAAVLTEENVKLKKGKESAMKEYELLESTNKHLKAEVEKVAKLEEGEKASAEMAKAELLKQHVQTETLTTFPANLPVLLHNAPPFAPFMWPMLFQSSNANQLLQGLSRPDPSKEQSSVNMAVPRSPVCILPLPLFFGLPEQRHHCQSQTSCCHKSKDTSEPLEMNNQQHHMACPSSRTSTADGKPDNTQEPDQLRPKASGLSGVVMLSNDLNEIPVESSPSDEAAQPSGALHEEALVGRVTDDASGHESGLCLSLLTGKGNVPSVPSSASDVVLPEQEKNHQGSSLTLSGKLDATGAAQARRRRQELKKLKAIHGSQCRNHC